MAKNEQLEQILIDLGLTENEATVYLASLSLGPTTVLNIAKAAELRRTTVYSVVEALKRKGLMHIELHGLKQLFVAEHPDKLESILDTRKNALARVLPQFTALYNLKGKESTLRYYEGLESIKTIYDTILEPMRPNDYYLVMGDMQKFFDMDREYFEDFFKKRVKAIKNARLIVTDNEQARYMQKFAKQFNHEIRVLPKGSELAVDVMIVPQKVTIFSLDEPLSAVSLENKSIIEMHRQLFEIMWNALPAPNLD